MVTESLRRLPDRVSLEAVAVEDKAEPDQVGQVEPAAAEPADQALAHIRELPEPRTPEAAAEDQEKELVAALAVRVSSFFALWLLLQLQPRLVRQQFRLLATIESTHSTTLARLPGRTDMAYFAQLDENNVVTQVISVNNSVIGEPEVSFPETEAAGVEFIASLGLSGVWKQTSFNGNFRACFAGIGYTYDEDSDIFVAPPIETPELDPLA